MIPMMLLGFIVGGAGGAGLGRILKLPMWPVTGSILGSAAANLFLVEGTTVPWELTFFAQVLVGTAVGASVLPGFFKELGKLIFPALIVVVVLVGAGVSAAVLMSEIGLIGSTEALLGMVPGGITEMAAAASALGADSALVAALHVIRLVISLWTLPLLIRWASRWQRNEDDG